MKTRIFHLVKLHRADKQQFTSLFFVYFCIFFFSFFLHGVWRQHMLSQVLFVMNQSESRPIKSIKIYT